MDKNRKENLKQTSRDLALDTFLNVGSELSAEVAKKSIKSAAGDLAIDAVSSFLPGLSGAVQGYKRARFERNMLRVAEELNLKVESIQSNLESKTNEQKEQIDRLFQYVLDSAIDEQQEEKIKYMVNGFVQITKHDFVSEDFVLTYYDVLKESRIIDISVLRLMNSTRFWYQEGSRETFHDVMERHGISYDQYEAVRRNLLRIGLLTTRTDLNVVDDLKEISKTFKDTFSYLEKLSNPKSNRLPKLKEPKFKSKEQFEISRFGKDFISFFFEKNQDEEEDTLL
ncbi:MULTISPECIES: hypothetical protein [unclassified Exiguobacterium]|uniref:hypothetical protein n=1 Tax=unclassified Exiguobacterium TaxID=2644629 RepID=UPI001BE6DCB7|nr:MULTISPECIES: hypothetical protein [unclassified Exiguobacterium]